MRVKVQDRGFMEVLEGMVTVKPVNSGENGVRGRWMVVIGTV